MPETEVAAPKLNKEGAGLEPTEELSGMAVVRTPADGGLEVKDAGCEPNPEKAGVEVKPEKVGVGAETTVEEAGNVEGPNPLA
jgi:hypothetical protein